MPDEVLEEPTDNDPNTVYEDTGKHERTGFRVDDSMALNNDPPTEKIQDGFDMSY